MVHAELETLTDLITGNQLAFQARVARILTGRVNFHEQQTVSIQMVDSRVGSELLAGGHWTTIQSRAEKLS